MRNFKDITQKELDYLKAHTVDVYEMLDLPYFKVEIDRDRVDIFTSKGKNITEIDAIINSVYKDIREFVINNIALNCDDIVDAFGPTKLGFFYKPVEKPNCIRYNNIPNGSFILNYFFTSDKSSKNVDKLIDIVGDCFYEYPFITELGCLHDVDVNADPKSLVEDIAGVYTWSKEPVQFIEGIILSSGDGKKKYKIVVNSTETNIDKSTLKIYRDFVVEDFARVMIDGDYITDINYGTDYIKIMCDLFLKYINDSELLLRTHIDPEDLLPPKEGYIGDIDYDKLNSTVSIICNGNEVFKNMFRIILVTFQPGVSERKFDSFGEGAKKNITQIFREINNKSLL